MMRKLNSALALIALATSAAIAAQPPYIGKWSGGPASCRDPFAITGETYKPPGSKKIIIDNVERDGNNYLLSFDDGYRVALFDVSRNSLTWHSPISGDTFELKRCK